MRLRYYTDIIQMLSYYCIRLLRMSLKYLAILLLYQKELIKLVCNLAYIVVVMKNVIN